MPSQGTKQKKAVVKKKVSPSPVKKAAAKKNLPKKTPGY